MMTCFRQWVKKEMLSVIQKLFEQQKTMYDSKTHRVDNRIVSILQPWVRPIVRGKQNADVEFGAQIEMSIANGFQRIKHLSWDTFNEGKTLIESAKAYRKAYGHYPERILADKIFRTRENLQFYKEK